MRLRHDKLLHYNTNKLQCFAVYSAMWTVINLPFVGRNYAVIGVEQTGQIGALNNKQWVKDYWAPAFGRCTRGVSHTCY